MDLTIDHCLSEWIAEYQLKMQLTYTTFSRPPT